MIDLSVFFHNHFDSERISDDRFNNFTNDHLQRLSATGNYSTLVTTLSDVYTNWSGATLTEATQEAIKQGQSKSMKASLAAMIAAVRQKEGTVRGQYGRDSNAYQEFFPEGLDEYNHANLGNIDIKMKRLIAAATAHADDVPGLAEQFTDLFTAFTKARNAQRGGKGQVSSAKTTSTHTRDVVEQQLMVNVLTIALDHIGDVNGGLAYFDQALLQHPQPATKPPPPDAQKTP